MNIQNAIKRLAKAVEKLERKLRDMESDRDSEHRRVEQGWDETDRLADRCMFLYEKAREHGATVDELRQ